MEGEVHYSTVTFKNRDQASGEKEEEDSTVYAVVTYKEAAATASNADAAARSHFPELSVCLGILYVLLVTSISVIIYISVLMDKQKANFRNLEAEIQQLIAERSILKKETERLSRVSVNNNHTMEFILKFKTFPVNEFCPEKKCQPCRKGWIQFQEKCYLFYNEKSPWKTWPQSRTHCQNSAADLVVVNSPQEQEFINQHIEYYYDRLHGYWMGLHKPNKTWQWVDGSIDTLRYWMEMSASGPCGHIIPGRNLTASWDTVECDFQNKFICETEVLIRSD